MSKCTKIFSAIVLSAVIVLFVVGNDGQLGDLLNQSDESKSRKVNVATKSDTKTSGVGDVAYSKKDRERVFRLLDDPTVEELAQAFATAGSYDNPGEIVRKCLRKAASLKSAEELTNFVALIDEGDREQVLMNVARNSALFSLKEIDSTLRVFGKKKLSISGIGIALENIISKMPLEEQQDAVDRYLEKVGELTEVSGSIVRYWMENFGVGSPVEAKEFLLSETPELVSFADGPWVRKMGKEAPNEVIDFINVLDSRGEKDRASQASLDFINSYSVEMPKEALEWARSLPPEFPDATQIIAQSFNNLLIKDKSEALRIAESEQEKYIRKIFESVIGFDKN